MNRVLQKIVAVLLCVTLASALLPAEQLGIALAVARAESAAAVTPQAYEELLDRAQEQRAGGGERSSGGWRYVLLAEQNLAVITGYDGAATAALEVPVLLEGADVAGIAEGALAGLSGVQRVSVPTNVIAIGQNALPAGAAVQGNSGVYAAKWARRNGHAFTSVSRYDFVSDVLDLTGIRPENYNRVSAEEIWLRELEASQIAVGTKFFLLDPDNQYQISYYRATALTPMAGGFVAVTCETPAVDEILYYYAATDETLMVDYSTLRLAEDTVVAPETAKALSGSVNGELGLKFSPDIDLGSGWKLSGVFSQTVSWTGSYEIGLFVDDKATIEQKSMLSGSVEMGYTYDEYATVNGEGELENEFDETLKDAVKEFAARKGEARKNPVEIDLPMGYAVVFSVAGIINASVSVRANLELEGKVSVTFTAGNITTYTYNNGTLSKESKRGEKTFEGSVEGTFKAGVTVSLELYVAVVKVFTAGLFGGVMAEVKLDFGQLLNLLGNFIASNFTEELVFTELFNVNMLDCVQIDVYLLVEISVKVGVGKLDLASGMLTLIKWKFITLHWHALPIDFTMEADGEDGYRYRVAGVKGLFDAIHIASKCPYDVKTAQFHLDDGDGDQIVRRFYNLPIGTMVEMPEVDAVRDYGVKLTGWHTDASFDADSLVAQWPWEIQGDVDFYANVLPLHRVTFVDVSGTVLGAEAVITDGEGEYSYLERERRVAQGETLTLPAQDSTGREILAWVLVSSADDLTPLGDELLPGDTLSITADSPEEVCLCALTEESVMARFYTGVGSSFQAVYGVRGEELTAPACEGSIPCRRFAGWQASDGTIVAAGDAIPTDRSTPAILIYNAVWEYTGELTAEDLANITIGTKPTTGTPVENEAMFSWVEVEGGVKITGFVVTDELVPVDVAVPSSIDGKTVVAIGDSAFAGTDSLRSIVFPGTVETLGVSALNNCTSLVFIDLAATGVTSIPNYFAQGCTSLVGALLPVGQIEAVGDNAFSDCRSFSKVNIDYDVGAYAFDGCTRLSTVNIGAGCTSLGDRAFGGCTRLTALVIPDSVKTVGSRIVYGCTKLQTLEIHSGVTAINADMFDIGETNALSRLTLGFGVTELAVSAFANDGYGFPSLTEVELPASLVKVGSSAFAGAGIETLTVGFVHGAQTDSAFTGLDSLRTLTVTSGQIGVYGFSDLPALETVNIGEAVTEIGVRAFQGCTALSTVNIQGAAAILGDYAFHNCTALQEVSLGEALLEIGDGAFSGCSALRSLIIPDSVTALGSRFLAQCYALQELSVGKVLNTLSANSDVFDVTSVAGDAPLSQLATLTLREGVTIVPDGTFDNYNVGFKALETVTLPSTLRTIGSGAFRDAGIRKLVINGSLTVNSMAFRACEQLEELEINGGVLSSYAFADCRSLRKVTLNASAVGTHAFSACAALTDLTIGEGVRTIGDYAFSDCTALTNLEIRYGVRTIGYQAFRNCTALTAVAFPDSVTGYDTYLLYNCTALTHLTVGGGAAKILDDVFNIGKNSALESVTIREGVTAIASGAFANDADGHTRLTEASFPASLQVVYAAFAGSALESVTLRGDVTLESGAFQGLTNLQRVTMAAGVVGVNAFNGCTALTQVNLGARVESVGGSAFADCTRLAEVNLGGVRSIQVSAFQNCTALTSLTIPDSVTEMDAGALSGCTALEYLSMGAIVDSLGTIPLGEGARLRTLEIREGATKIPANTFNNNGKYLKHLETVSLPATLSSIGLYAFSFSGVQRVTIKGETSIGSYAFQDCARLEEVSIAGGKVGDYAFDGCVSLRTAEILSGEIARWAFRDCVSLETLHLGDGVTTIKYQALRNCRSLKALVIPDSVTTLGSDIIEGCTGIERIVVGGGVGGSLGDTPGNYSPFNVGAPSSLRTLIISEGVTDISEGVFANYDVSDSSFKAAHGFAHLEEVVIPASVQYVRANAFGKAGLRSVTVKGAPQILNSAFANLTALEEATIAGGVLSTSAFEGCTALESVTLGEGVTGIGAYCFRGCESLRSLYIPDSVTSYGGDMIRGCTSLTTLSLGSGVRNVYNGRFDVGPGSALKVLEVREGVLTLETNAFSNVADGSACGFAALETVLLPYTLTKLGEGNLENWPQLRHLHLRYGSALPADDVVSPALTVYTDYYNAKVDDFALAHGIGYIIRDEMDFPAYTLKLVTPSGAVLNEVLEESDGSLVATQGAAGEAAVLPVGYALLDKARLQFTDEIALPTLEAAPGYAFYGWYTDREFNFPWTGTTMPAANLTLYARVEPLIRVRFAVNAAGLGTADAALPDGWTLYDSYAVQKDAEFVLPEDPAADGWNFRGWYVDEACTLGCRMTRTPDADLIVYGKLERLSIGGEYRAVDGGLRLTKYTLEQDESPAVYIPAKVNGVPVVSLGSGAFEGSGVKSVVIPSTVTEIQPGALNCSTLVSIGVSAANTAYTAQNGVLFTADATELVAYPHRRADTSYTVPAGVCRIGAYAFAGNTTLTAVNFSGSSLTEIGQSAFSGMTKLTSVSLPDSTAILRLNAFANCTALSRFTAYGLETIETLTGMDTLPCGTGMQVFGPVGEGALRDYFTVTDSGGLRYTMQYNQYMLQLYLNAWETMYVEAGQLLPDMLADVVLDNGTVVNEWRLDSASGTPVDLATYTMPAKTVNLYAAYTPLFTGSGKTVTDAAGTSYSGYVYTGWNGAGSAAVIPASYGGFTSRGIGEGFLASSNAFTRITIPSCVVSIAEGALDGYTGVIVCDPGSCAALWAQANGVEWEPILYTLSFVTMGEEISPMQAAMGTLIALPDAQRAGFAFNGWHTDEYAGVDVSLTDAGLYAMPGGDTVLYAGWDGEEEEVPFTWTASGKQVTVTAYTGSDAAVTIPDTINSWPVVAVAPSAFAGTGVTSVDLGPVQRIGSGAFEGCEALRSVTMDSVTEIGAEAFAGCLLLRAPSLPDTLISVGDSAFEGCEAIGGVVLPDSVTALGRSVFAGCTALKTVTVGAGVKRLAADQFSGCTLLREISVAADNAQYQSVDGMVLSKDGTELLLCPVARTSASADIPQGVAAIGPRAFAGAKSLTQVTFPESLLSIGDSAFEGCAVEKVILSHVETIGDGAFFGCASLTQADLGDSLTAIGVMAFASCGNLRQVIIPATVQMNDGTAVFSQSAALMIVGTTGSAAQSYAKANGIAFTDPDAAAVEQILLSAESLTLNRGESAALTAEILPLEAASDLTWSVGDNTVALVDETGLVRGIGGGTTTVSVTADNGVSARCIVTVAAAVEQIIPDVVKPLLVGESTAVGVSFVPASPTNTNLTWTTEDESIAAVSPQGVITGVGLGSTVVTATADNGVSARIAVTVYTPVETLSIEADSTEMLAVKGLDTLQLRAVVTPQDASFADCLWISDDITRATVSDDGLVTALRTGTVVITATGRDPARPVATLTLTIAAADLAAVATVEITRAHLTASGYVLDYTVTAGDEVLDTGDYTAAVPEITGSGEYVLTLTGKDRFTGTLEIPFVMQEIAPEITMDERSFVWIDELNPVIGVSPETAYTLEYVLLGEDGSRTSVGGAPTVSGLYEVIARTEATQTQGAAQARATLWIQLDGGLAVYESITLTAGQKGRIPVTMESEYAPLQSGYGYASSDESVFTVDENGRITAVGAGSATLTVTGADDSRFTGSCVITVASLPTLTLPAALTDVEAEAFAGMTAIRRIVAGSQVAFIGSRAFADMSALEQLVIESGSVTISADALAGSDPLIVCPAGSPAAIYAAAHGLKTFVD